MFRQIVPNHLSQNSLNYQSYQKTIIIAAKDTGSSLTKLFLALISLKLLDWPPKYFQ